MNLDMDMLMYMLGGMGGALGGQGSWQQSLGGAAQQGIASKNMMQLLSKMLGGEMVPGSSIKMSDKGDYSISFPKAAMQGSELQGGTPGMRDVAQQQMTGVRSIEPIGGVKNVNPFRIAL